MRLYEGDESIPNYVRIDIGNPYMIYRQEKQIDHVNIFMLVKYLKKTSNLSYLLIKYRLLTTMNQ